MMLIVAVITCRDNKDNDNNNDDNNDNNNEDLKLSCCFPKHRAK